MSVWDQYDHGPANDAASAETSPDATIWMCGSLLFLTDSLPGLSLRRDDLSHMEMQATRSRIEISEYARRLGVEKEKLMDDTGCGIMGLPTNIIWLGNKMHKIYPCAGRTRYTTILNAFLLYLLYEIGLPYSEMVKNTDSGRNSGTPIHKEPEESYFFLATRVMSSALGMTWLDSIGADTWNSSAYYKASKALLIDALFLYQSVEMYSFSPSGLTRIESILSLIEENEGLYRKAFKGLRLPLGNPLVRAGEALRRGIPTRFYSRTILEEVITYGSGKSEKPLPSKGFPNVSSSLWAEMKHDLGVNPLMLMKSFRRAFFGLCRQDTKVA